MDHEREDYADLHLPPRWTAERIATTVLRVVFVVLVVAMLALFFEMARR
jgi:hypothetical protein